MKWTLAIIGGAGIGIVALTGCNAGVGQVAGATAAEPAAEELQSGSSRWERGSDASEEDPQRELSRWERSDAESRWQPGEGWPGSADPGRGQAGAPSRDASVTPASWRCAYSPTMNYDWHDDVLCTNGSDFDRPYLRPWDSFVTYDEIMQSARDYERQLNSR